MTGPVRTAFGGSRIGAAGYVTKALIGLNVLGLLLGAVLTGLPAVIGDGLFTNATKLQMLGATFAPTYVIGPGNVPAGTEVGELYTGIDDGAVYHTYSAYSRGVDGIWAMYQWLDRAPRGRNENGVWWRRHDEYEKR